MADKSKLRYRLRYAIPAAILYCIMAGIFLYNDSYKLSYLLYIGNVLFGICILLFLLAYNKTRPQNEKPKLMIAAGHMTAAAGIVISIVIVLILMAILRPTGYESVSLTREAVKNPAPALQGDTHPLFYILFLETIVGNIAISSILSFLIPNTAKSNEPNV